MGYDEDFRSPTRAPNEACTMDICVLTCIALLASKNCAKIVVFVQLFEPKSTDTQILAWRRLFASAMIK